MINSLDPDQTRQNVKSDLGPTSLTQSDSQFRPWSGSKLCVKWNKLCYMQDHIVFCLFDLILLVLVNNFSMMYQIVPWVGLLIS